MPDRVLIVEDDKGIADSVAYTLRQEGFEVQVAADGPSGLDAFRSFRPDLVILDLMLPGLHGFDVFRAIRRHANTPVIMLTAKAEESDRVAGIELGADDYVVKPFSMRELIARVRMVLRRSRVAAEAAEEILELGEIVIDPARHVVTVRGEEVALTPKEFALLEYLARNRGRALTRAMILENVWGSDQFIDEHTVDVHIRWLRQKIERQPSRPRLIVTVRGVGYKLNA
ncbi:MAG: response regulator transcription factor [Armatimonadetes bacterium]|nr:response regulator transcription factor [Armatimonadota bacterium]